MICHREMITNNVTEILSVHKGNTSKIDTTHYFYEMQLSVSDLDYVDNDTLLLVVL